jgi:hypothetical protein
MRATCPANPTSLIMENSVIIHVVTLLLLTTLVITSRGDSDRERVRFEGERTSIPWVLHLDAVMKCVEIVKEGNFEIWVLLCLTRS